jgi:hypothetical protein
MRALEAARTVGATEWAIGAGAVRDQVWSRLHGREHESAPRDVDLVFFDPSDLTPEHDRRVTDALRQQAPDVTWEAVNQAAVHHWYERRFGVPVAPLPNVEAGIATWPETCTAVAVRLDERDRLHVIAPYGLDDLFQLIVRHNPARVTVEQFHARVRDKRWLERWPRLRVVPPLP